MEQALTGILSTHGASLEDFMDDCRSAVNGGEGFLFEDENYHEFVEAVMAMDDFEAFHEVSINTPPGAMPSPSRCRAFLIERHGPPHAVTNGA